MVLLSHGQAGGVDNASKCEGWAGIVEDGSGISVGETVRTACRGAGQ